MKGTVDEGRRSMLFGVASPMRVVEYIWRAYIVPNRKVTDVSENINNERLEENMCILIEKLLEGRVRTQLCSL
jgi:hypothetical protein